MSNNTFNKKKHFLPSKAVIVVSLLSMSFVSVFADQLPITPVIEAQTKIVQSTIGPSNLVDQAKQWGLSTDDYQHYLWLMQNTPSSKWYIQLDPAEVLALNTDNQSDMMKYAQIQAQNMHTKVSRELTFDKLYTQAYRELYPNERPIQSSLIKPVSAGLTLQSGDRIWLFTGTDTPLGSFAYHHLINEIQKTPHTVLDIYFVGNQVNQAAIEQWAKACGITPNQINQTVTLNYGNDRFQEATQGKNTSLPYVGFVKNQHFQPITLSSIL